MSLFIESKEIRRFDPSKAVVATTAFYPKFDDETSDDRVRGNLLIALAYNSHSSGYQTAIVDGGSSAGFISRLNEMGIKVHPQKTSGMAESRFQSYSEATLRANSEVIIWTEEKPSLISRDLDWAINLILNNHYRIIVPARTEEGFLSYPKYQMLSEKSANSIITSTLIRHKKEHPRIFPNLKSIPPIDWFYGPKVFSMRIVSEFTNNTDFWRGFINHIKTNKPEKMKAYGYCGPLILPVIYEWHLGNPVGSIEMRNYRYPQAQREIEEKMQNVYLKKRAEQLANINIIVDQFCQYLLHHN